MYFFFNKLLKFQIVVNVKLEMKKMIVLSQY